VGRLITITSSAVKQPVEDFCFRIRFAPPSRLARTLANEYGADGITVNNVCPASLVLRASTIWLPPSPSVPARSLKKFSPAGSAKFRQAAWALRKNSRRWSRFLASERASYINGTSIAVDGGLSGVSSSSQCPSPPPLRTHSSARTFRDFAARGPCADSRMGNARPLLLRHAHWR